MNTLPAKPIKSHATRYKLLPTFSGGFTLLELLVVMAIISTLAGLFITSFPAAQRRARDVKRRSDLKQYSALLRNYAIDHKGYYPGANGSGIRMNSVSACPSCAVKIGLCDILGINNNNCLIDQYDFQNKCFNSQLCVYYYQGSNCGDGSACANSFVLRTRLEGEAGWLVYCSNGSTGVVSESTDWTKNLGFCPL
jgi:prepilin-type N-terminal cleavage/methylation domain-containing protein